MPEEQEEPGVEEELRKKLDEQNVKIAMLRAEIKRIEKINSIEEKIGGPLPLVATVYRTAEGKPADPTTCQAVSAL